MIENIEAIAQRHKTFVDTACETLFVYTIKNQEGYALIEAQEYLDDEDLPLELMCFWSHEEMAKALLTEDWEEYEVATISLAEFLERWCIGMSGANMIIGTNFDEKMYGYEVHPLELTMEILHKLKEQNTELDFTQFESVADFIAAIEASLEQ